MAQATPTQIRAYTSLRHLVYRVSDGLCIVFGLALAHQYGQRLSPEQMLAACALTAICYLLASNITANYRSWKGTSFYAELGCAWTTWMISLASIVVLGAVTQYGSGLTRWTFGLWTILSAVLLGMSRSTIRTIQANLRRRDIATRGFAIVGVTDLGIKLAENIEDSPQLGLSLRGFYDDRPEARTKALLRDVGNRMGQIDDLVEHCRQGEVGVVYITFPMCAEDRIREVISRLADSTASVYIVPDFFVFELLHSRWTDIQGIPAVSVFENPFFGVDGVTSASSTWLLVAWPWPYLRSPC